MSMFMLFGMNMLMKTVGLELSSNGQNVGEFDKLRDLLVLRGGATSEAFVSNLAVALGFIEPATDNLAGPVGAAMFTDPAVIALCRTLAGRIAGTQFMSVTKSRDTSLEFGDQTDPASGDFLGNTATFEYAENVFEPAINTEEGRMLAAQKQFARQAIAKQGGMIYSRMGRNAGIVTKAAGPYDKGGIYRADLGGSLVE